VNSSTEYVKTSLTNADLAVVRLGTSVCHRRHLYTHNVIYRVRQIKVIPCRVLLMSQQRIGNFFLQI